jgi:Na+/H+ antiporter NhaD/arsenite permease-like protein
VTPAGLLALVIAASAGLSALLVNDVVCLAFTPMLIDGCRRRGLSALPFLLALACASNVGSAATLIGNPQNMLIGQALRLSFAGYLLDGLPVAALGCGAVWAVIAWQFRGRWRADVQPEAFHSVPFDRWQTIKGVAVLAALVALFLLSPWPREVLALAAAGLLLLSRKLHSRYTLGLVDWQLLVLFIGLFVVNHALEAGGSLAVLESGLREAGVDLRHGGWLFGAVVLLSNLVSNVPAVMLLLPYAEHPLAGPILALASTLAGNLLLVGSIANLIVVEQAALLGVRIGWREHARTGVPVAAATLAIAAAWLWGRAEFGA